MIVICAECGRKMGVIEGRLLKGWRMICAECYNKNKEIPEFLKGLFNDKRRRT